MAKFSHVQFPNGDIHDVVGTDVVDQQSIKSGSLVNFSTNVALPLTALSSTIVAQQASGTPTPSSPLPITGVSEVNLTKTGKNLLAKPFIFNNNDDLDSLSECFFIKKGSYIASFGSMSNADNWRFIIRLKDASGNNLNTSDYITFNTGFQWSTTRKAWINGANTTAYSCIFTLNQDCYIRILFGVGNTSSSSVASNAQLEAGSTATTYEAYNSDTFTIALGQTVYGGVLDVKSGKATITHGKSVFDGSDENWSLASDGTVNRRFVLYGIPALKNGSTAIANYLVYATGTSHDWGTFTLGKSEQYGYYIVLHDKSSNFASTGALKSYLAEHNLELVYELATPVEITGLTPTNFTTFAGEQNIFSNSGEVTVKYFAGTNVNKAIDDISKININAHHDTLVNLTDTAISSPSNSQIVKYNGTKWVNADNSASGVALSGSTMQIQNTTVQKFLDVLYDALKDTTVELTASGSIATFTTSLELPLVSMSAEIVAQQASGTPTPSSPLPITGVSSIGLTQTGKNIFSSSIVQGALYASGSESSTTTTRVKTDDYIICKSNTQYVVSFNSGIIPVSAVYYDKNKVYISGETLTGPTFTTPLNCAYVRFGIAKTNTTQNITPSDVTQTQLEEGSTATAYEPYNAETKTIALGQTVYGGEVDAINGKATITRIGYNLKDYTGSITKVGSGSSTYFRFDDLTPYPDTRTGYFMISDKYEKAVITTTTTAVGISAGTPSTLDHTTIFFRPENPDTYTTTTIMDYIINTLGGVQVVYDLATPQEITGLTPANFTTFAGEQNIFSDSGDISVSFKQGIQEYIDAKIAETQA